MGAAVGLVLGPIAGAVHKRRDVSSRSSLRTSFRSATWSASRPRRCRMSRPLWRRCGRLAYDPRRRVDFEVPCGPTTRDGAAMVVAREDVLADARGHARRGSCRHLGVEIADEVRVATCVVDGRSVYFDVAARAGLPAPLALLARADRDLVGRPGGRVRRRGCKYGSAERLQEFVVGDALAALVLENRVCRVSSFASRSTLAWPTSTRAIARPRGGPPARDPHRPTRRRAAGGDPRRGGRRVGHALRGRREP